MNNIDLYQTLLVVVIYADGRDCAVRHTAMTTPPGPAWFRPP